MRLLFLGLAAAASPALGQTIATPPVIRVIGHGSIKSPPDLAAIAFSVRGEGATSDDAVRMLVAKREKIEAALSGKAEVRTGRLSVQEARDKACDSGEDDDKPRLSTGACMVKGYVATLGMTARVTAVAEAGTLLGLASRLGATAPSLGDFQLTKPATAQRAAVADAIRDAREQASVIATASHVALGRVRRVEDQRAIDVNAQDIIVTANRAPQEMVQPVMVKLVPEPIETVATLIVEFEIGGSAP